MSTRRRALRLAEEEKEVRDSIVEAARCAPHPLPTPPPTSSRSEFSRWFRKAVEPRAAFAMSLASSSVGISGSVGTASMLALFEGMGMADDPGVRFLDVGSGTGIVLLLSATLYPHAEHHGIELDPNQFVRGLRSVAGTGVRMQHGDAVTFDYSAMRPSHAFSFDEGMPVQAVLAFWDRIAAAGSLRRFVSFRLSPTVVRRAVPHLSASHVLHRVSHVLSVSCVQRGSGRRYSGHVWSVCA